VGGVHATTVSAPRSPNSSPLSPCLVSTCALPPQVRVLASNKELAPFIDPAEIPVMVGGTCACDGDPECRRRIVAGGPVPASLRHGLASTAETVTIDAGKMTSVEVAVTVGTKVGALGGLVPGSRVGWVLWQHR
jgi:hypothetical protein